MNKNEVLVEDTKVALPKPKAKTVRKRRPKNADEILSLLEATYGDTPSALHFNNNFQLLVAVLLSAQTNDNQVNKVTETLFLEYPMAKDMSALSIPEIEERINKIGLYKNKAKNLHATIQILLEKYDGEVPHTMEELIELPGVGRKTANVVMSVGFGLPALAVDTHVFRVSHRTGFSTGSTPDAVEADLCRIIPRDDWARAHHWFIWHGRKVCDARKPKCDVCPLFLVCPKKL